MADLNAYFLLKLFLIISSSLQPKFLICINSNIKKKLNIKYILQNDEDLLK